MGGIVIIELEESLGIEAFQLHQRLIEVGAAAAGLSRHGLVPHLRHCGDIVIMLTQEIVQPIALIAVPLVREGQVMTLAEDADALAEHLAGIRLGSLPLGRLFPDSLSAAARQMEACIVCLRVLMSTMLREAHILEGVSHLVSHRMAYRFACRWSQPQGADLIVVAATIAHPVGGVVQ